MSNKWKIPSSLHLQEWLFSFTLPFPSEIILAIQKKGASIEIHLACLVPEQRPPIGQCTPDDKQGVSIRDNTFTLLHTDMSKFSIFVAHPWPSFSARCSHSNQKRNKPKNIACSSPLHLQGGP